MMRSNLFENPIFATSTAQFTMCCFHEYGRVLVWGMLMLVAGRERPVAATELTLAPTHAWSTAFCDNDIPIILQVQDASSQGGTVHWTHTAHGRTLNAGTVAVDSKSLQRGTVELTLRPQSLRDGVVLKTSLSTTFIPNEENASAITHDQTLWLFPRDPLANCRRQIASLELRLFDPVGTTVKAFDDIDLPYQRVDHPNELSDPKWNGVFVIGEGISLNKHPTLAAHLFELALNGRRGILLSPVDGTFSLPGFERRDDPLNIGPTELRFASNDILNEYDQRLDHIAWHGAGETIPSRGLVIETDRNQIVANVSDDAHAWPFVDVSYKDREGRVVICGFELITHWQAGPTPRYFFIRLLQSLDKSPHSHSKVR